MGAEAGSSSLRGVELVAGTSIQRYGLLVVPRAGGTAELRAVEEPSDVLWRGRTALPPASEVHGLEGVAILRTAEGRVYRYSPARDALEELGRVSPGARWSASAGHGLWSDPDASALLSISREGAWRYEMARPVSWAAPLDDGGLVVLVGGGSESELWLLRGGEHEPEATSRLGLAPPGIVTAWGRRVALLEGEGRHLVFVGVPQLRRTGEVPLAGEVRVIASSPSTHQLYVAMASRPQVSAVNRFRGTVRPLAALDRPAEALRPSLFGDFLLAHDGERTWWLPLEGERPRALELDWRTDLPIGLPDYRVLGVRNGSVRLLRLEGRDVGREIDGSADAWWTVVRWRPPRAPVVATRVQAEARTAEAEARTAEEVRTPEPGPDGAGDVGPPARAEPEREARAEREVPRRPGDEPRADGEVEGAPTLREAGAPPPPASSPGRGALDAGFYAIVSSSQNLAGVADLAHALREAGYRARLQRHRDEADEIWFRCLVGPYPDRQAAERIADRLRAERGLQAWITEVAPEAPTSEILR